MVSGKALVYLQAVVGAIAEAQAAVWDLPPAQPPQQGYMVLDVPSPPARRLTYSIGDTVAVKRPCSSTQGMPGCCRSQRSDYQGVAEHRHQIERLSGDTSMLVCQFALHMHMLYDLASSCVESRSAAMCQLALCMFEGC